MLSIRNIAISFAGIRALCGVSFDVKYGRIMGLIGPNGSGKSTLINIAAGLILPDKGEIKLAERQLPLGRAEHVAMCGVARTFQIPRLARKLTVIQNLIVGQRGHPGENFLDLLYRPARVHAEEKAAVLRAFAMLERLGLAPLADHCAGGLSGGQQKLLSMGMALMADPRVMLLDEPAAGVNPVLIAQQIRFLRELAMEGRILLLVEHNMEMVSDLCDEVVVLDAGSIIARGTPAEIRRDRTVMRSYLGEIA